jgi:hypothetical protein
MIGQLDVLSKFIVASFLIHFMFSQLSVWFHTINFGLLASQMSISQMSVGEMSSGQMSVG